MAQFYTDEQVQEAVAALKREWPGIWELMIEVGQDPFADNDEKIGRIMRAQRTTFEKLPFVAGAGSSAFADLVADVVHVARSEIRSAGAGKKDA